jgi:hypothetical protein
MFRLKQLLKNLFRRVTLQKALPSEKIGKAIVKANVPDLGKPPKGWLPIADLANILRQLDRETEQKRAANGDV